MKFPGKRTSVHYFPVSEKGRSPLEYDYVADGAYHVTGIEQPLVDIEIHVPDEFLIKHQIAKGQSQILDDNIAEIIYQQVKEKKWIHGEFAGGAIGNTLHNFSTLSDERSVELGAISRNIIVGDYAFKYICHTSSKVDLLHLQPCEGHMGRAMCFVTPDGERSFGISKGCMNELSSASIPGNVIQNSAALLITAFLLRDEKAPIYEATFAACRAAKAADIPIVLTLGTSSLIEAKRDFFVNFIKEFVSVVAMNDNESAALTGETDVLKSGEKALNWCDLALITVGAKGLYLCGYVDEKFARKTKDELHTKSIINYNQHEYSRAMPRKNCHKPLKIYSHINPFLGGPKTIKNTNGAGDAALAALLHDISANKYHKDKIPNSPKHITKFLTYSSISQICKYANRVSFEILNQNSPRLLRGLPEKDESLMESYWDK